MKNLIVLITLVMLSYTYVKEEKALSVTIKYIDWEILTIIRVDCDQLESYKEHIRSFEITDKNELNIIENYVKNFQFIESELKPDVRIKLKICYRNQVKFLCIGKNQVIEFDKKIIKYNQEFVDYIKHLIKENES
jgi:hypothetical protein